MSFLFFDTSNHIQPIIRLEQLPNGFIDESFALPVKWQGTLYLQGIYHLIAGRNSLLDSGIVIFIPKIAFFIPFIALLEEFRLYEPGLFFNGQIDACRLA